MAQKLLKVKKHRLVPKKTVLQRSDKVVLVGTYKGDQLSKWPGYYNYPICADDTIDVESCKAVNELWLVNGDNEVRYFTSEFIGIKSRKELKEDFGYPARGKPHGTGKYLLFKTGKGQVYKPSTGLAKQVIIRIKDLKTSPGIQRQLKAYLESPDRNNPELAKRLPRILTKLPPEILRVCENAVQLDFWVDEDTLRRQASKSIWDKDVDVEKSSYLWTKIPYFQDRLEPLQEGRLNVLELFCGCGGTSCGFEMAGYQTVMGVDILEPAIATFRNNHRTAATYLGDIKSVSAEDILSHVNQPIDVVIAGIPCQGFSLNNRKRHDTDKRNVLYLELLRILRTIRPRAVVVENVSGIRSSNNGQVVAEIERGIFEACGLTVRHRLLHAVDYGVPQRRSRVVFVGVRNPEGFDFDDVVRTHGPGTGHPYVNIHDAIGDLPVLESGQSSRRYDHEPDCEYQRFMRRGAEVLLNHSAPTHPQETIDKIAHTIPGEPMYPRFKQRIRLSWDIQSPTQVSGGIRPQFQFGHPEQARGLTIRERCRIQSFPDTFNISGGLVQGRVQTGNAVPPLLARALATALRNYL